jgi:hypothetical protein
MDDPEELKQIIKEIREELWLWLIWKECLW